MLILCLFWFLVHAPLPWSARCTTVSRQQRVTRNPVIPGHGGTIRCLTPGSSAIGSSHRIIIPKNAWKHGDLQSFVHRGTCLHKLLVNLVKHSRRRLSDIRFVMLSHPLDKDKTFMNSKL